MRVETKIDKTVFETPKKLYKVVKDICIKNNFKGIIAFEYLSTDYQRDKINIAVSDNN